MVQKQRKTSKLKEFHELSLLEAGNCKDTLLARFVCIFALLRAKIKVRLGQALGGSAHPRRIRSFKSGINYKKSAIPVGMTDFLELLARFELATSSLPRMRSTG